MYWYTLSLPVPVPVCVIVRVDGDIAFALGLAEVDEETGIGFLVDERIAGGVVAQAVAEDLRGAMFLVEGDIEQRSAGVGPDETSLRLLHAVGQQRPAFAVLHIDSLPTGTVSVERLATPPAVGALP